MMRCFILAIAAALASATGTPTAAPTKSTAEIDALAACAASRASSLSDTYTTPEATKLRQEYRNGYFNWQAKLDAFDFNMEKMMSDPTGSENQALAQDYIGGLLWSSLWPFLLIVISVGFFVPVTCCKVRARSPPLPWVSPSRSFRLSLVLRAHLRSPRLLPQWWGECTACPLCCMAGKGCCGRCNDFFCGCAKCPHFGICDGWCRYGPIADYPTFGCTANYEHDPNYSEDDAACGGTKIELDDGQEYHERDDVFGQRMKPMESRCAIPNIVWLALMFAFGVGTYVCGITGQLNTLTMIDGMKTTAEEGGCIIADSIDFVESIHSPIKNITSEARQVIWNTNDAIVQAQNLGTSLTEIGTAMTALKTHINLDSCSFVTHGILASWPPTSLADAATAVGTAAAAVNTAAANIVETLDDTLGSVQIMLQSVNGTLSTAVASANEQIDPMMELLRDTLSPINGQIATYIDIITTWQGTFVQVLFGLIFGLAGVIVLFSIIWLAFTEFYECEQKKETSATGVGEADGEDDEDEPRAHGCKDCFCAVFQINCIAVHHLLYVTGWTMMMLCFIIALVFNPVTIVMSDACVTIDHFAQHSTQWLTSPGSQFANETLMIDALGSCMDIQSGNLLGALGIQDVLGSFTNVSFGDASAVDVNVDFSEVDTMKQTTDAITLADVADFATKASDLITTLNTAIAAGGVATGTQYTVSPPDNRCYSTAATTACTPRSDNGCTCAKDLTYGTSGQAANIKAARDGVLQIWDTKECTNTYITKMQTDTAAIKVLTDKLVVDIAYVKNALGAADGSMTPVTEQIGVLINAGSCAFVRRRMNGMLGGVCGPVLEGTVKLAWDLTLIGVFLFGLMFMVQMCAVTRFRMYDVACWHHDHSAGCGGEVADDEDEANKKIEMTAVGAMI